EHALSCEFELISCIRHGCGEKILRRSLAEHLEDSCQMRVVHCHYCKEEVIWRDLKNHHKQCPEYLIACKFCGKKGIPRRKITEHTDAEIGDCKKKVGSCKFKKVGCNDL
ncbi:TNF receptor-associated factor 5-like, partial [Saccoglossus kowalevskii]